MNEDARDRDGVVHGILIGMGLLLLLAVIFGLGGSIAYMNKRRQMALEMIRAEQAAQAAEQARQAAQIQTAPPVEP